MSYGLTPKSSDGVPLGTIIVPSNTTPLVLKGGNQSTDSQNNTLASLCAVADATIVLNQVSAAKTTSSNSADLSVGAFTELLLGFNITAVSGTSPTIQFSLNVKGPDNVYYTHWTGSTYSVAPQKVLTSIGSGCSVNLAFGSTIQVVWTIGGTSPSFTFSLWMIGK